MNAQHLILEIYGIKNIKIKLRVTFTNDIIMERGLYINRTVEYQYNGTRNKICYQMVQF